MGVKKMMMSNCTRREPPHPCDPPAPCDPCDSGDPCPTPSLCTERIKNPQKGYETRCKPGNFLPARKCTKQDDHHPCDPPLPCIPGIPKKEICPDPFLCREKVPNVPSIIVICPDPDDLLSYDLCDNKKMLETPIAPCTSKPPCAPPELTDPFLSEILTSSDEKCVDTNEYLYSRVICKNMDMLKESIKTCFTPKPCSPPELTDPFLSQNVDIVFPEDEDDPCFPKKIRKRKCKE